VDAAKLRHAVAVAEDGRQGEVRYLGEIGADAASVRRLVAKLEKRHGSASAGQGRGCLRERRFPLQERRSDRPLVAAGEPAVWRWLAAPSHP